MSSIDTSNAFHVFGDGYLPRVTPRSFYQVRRWNDHYIASFYTEQDARKCATTVTNHDGRAARVEVRNLTGAN